MQKFFFLLFFICLNSFTNAQIYDYKTPSVVNRFSELNENGIYLEYYNHDNTFALAKKNNKYGVLGKDNSIIIPFEYDVILNLFQEKLNVIVVKNNNNFFLVDKNNKTKSKYYDYLYGPYLGNLYRAELDNKFTFINSDGKEFKNWYDNELSFEGNYCVVSFHNKFGLIDKDENLIIPVIYDNIKSGIKDNQIIVKKDKYGVINLQNQEIINFKYDDINFSNVNGNFKSEYYIKLNDKLGIIDGKNNIVINTLYDAIYELNDGYRKARKENFYGLLDENGKEVIPFEYNGLYKFDNKDRVRVSKNKLWGVIDLNNMLIVPMLYSKISNYSYKTNNEYSKSKYIYSVSLDRIKYFIVDENNKIIKQ